MVSLVKNEQFWDVISMYVLSFTPIMVIVI